MVSCPQCGKLVVRLASRRTTLECVLRVLTIYPFRCQLCAHRFHAFLGKPSFTPRRDFQRVLVRYPVSFRPAFSSEQHQGLKGVMINLSIRGCSITTEVPVRNGTYLHLEFTVDQSEPPVEIESAAVRSFADKHLGLEFLQVRREDAGRIQRIIEERLRSLSRLR